MPHTSRRSGARRLPSRDAAAGLLLLFATAAALALANSPLAACYAGLWRLPLAGLTLGHWIDDGLMTLFFLQVGLEIKHELLSGQLAAWRQRALPGCAALGGMLMPALIYGWVNRHSDATLAGWAIPAATDIAFALGVLALLGRRVPPSLKVFLGALAILDDLGAVALIALFYSGGLAPAPLLAALAVGGLLVALNRLGVARLTPYLALGLPLWFCLLHSGLHATLAGVVLAACVPLRSAAPVAPARRLHERLQPWVAFAIVPLFGFANAGIGLVGVTPAALLAPVPLGIALGLLFGKQVGVLLATLLAVRSGLAQRPAGASWGQLYGVALLCGIGFTMSLFIGGLAFADQPARLAEVKLGVLLGSGLAALAGVAVLLACGRRRQALA